MIAETARHRSDFTVIDVPAQYSADLALLTAHRADLVADRVRMLNRFRDTLTSIFPALERAFDYSGHNGPWCCSPSAKPPELSADAGGVRGVRGGAHAPGAGVAAHASGEVDGYGGGAAVGGAGGRRRTGSVRGADVEPADQPGSAGIGPGTPRDAAAAGEAARILAKASKILTEVLDLVAEHQADVGVAALWAAVEEAVPHTAVAGAVATIEVLVPEDDGSAEAAMREKQALRYTVRPFLSLLGESDALGAAPAGRRILKAVRRQPPLSRRRVKDRPLLPREVDVELVPAMWKRAVVSNAKLPQGAADCDAYVVCVLERLHRALNRRDVFASRRTGVRIRARGCCPLPRRSSSRR